MQGKYLFVDKLKVIKNTIGISYLFIFQLKSQSYDQKPLDLGSGFDYFSL